jgi:hypothetical protein
MLVKWCLETHTYGIMMCFSIKRNKYHLVKCDKAHLIKENTRRGRTVSIAMEQGKTSSLKGTNKKQVSFITNAVVGLKR